MKRFIATISNAGLTLHVFKTALAAGIAWLASTTLLSGPYPYFAPLAAILTIQVTVADSLKAAFQRFTGIVGGVILSMLVGYWLPIGTLSIFIMILLGMTIATRLHFSVQISSQIGMTSLLVLAIGQPHGPSYAIGRIIETFVGSFVAILINALLIPPNYIPAAEKQVRRLSALASNTLTTLALQLEQTSEMPDSYNANVDHLVNETSKAIKAILVAEESLKYSPFTIQSRRKLVPLVAAINNLEHITIEIRGIYKGLTDLDLNTTPPSIIHKLKVAIKMTAACLPFFGESLAHPSPEISKCLIHHVTIAQSTQHACLLSMSDLSSPELLRDMGAILTDLNRILKGVTN